MVAYKPFTIFDKKQGQIGARDPWLLPQDAFVEMQNCHLDQGVLEKRRGRSQFAQIFHRITSEVIDSTPNGTLDEFSGTLGTIPLTSNSIIITATHKTTGLIETITPTSGDAEILEGDDGAAGTINYTTGDWTLDFDGSTNVPANGSEITATYIDATAPGDPIMGIKNYFDGDTETTLAFDYTRAHKYDTSSSLFLDMTRLKIHFKPGGVQDTAPVIGDVCTGGTTGATGTFIGGSQTATEIKVTHSGIDMFRGDETVTGSLSGATVPVGEVVIGQIEEAGRARTGTRLRNALDGFGAWLGVSGNILGGFALFLFFAITAGFVFTATGNVHGAILVSLPVILMGNYMGLTQLNFEGLNKIEVAIKRI
ncbi:hypothetical protein LCGC14_2820240, partial [marine sediment metagenome]